MNKKKETTWQTGLIQGPGVTRDGAIGKDGVIVVTDDKGKIFRSADGGKNWDIIKTNLGDWCHLFGVATDGFGRFVTVGRGRVILTSTDNGLSWALVQQKSADRSIYKVAFGKNKLVIAADEEVGYHVSNDGGITWAHNQDKKLKALRTIEYLNGSFYAGTPSAVWRSVDGVSWSRVETDSVGARALAYNEINHTFFAGGHAISRSLDDGKNWEQLFDLKPRYGEDANIMSITCFDDYVICVGAEMLTLVSKDNGASWGQLGSYPAKGGFLGLVQTGDRLIGVGTFEKDSEPVCYIEKAALINAELIELTPATEPIPVPPPTPKPTPTPNPTPTPTVTMNKILADELEGIGNSLIRIANCLRSLTA